MNIRVAARSVQGGGWQKSHTRDDTIGQRDFTQGRILLDWKPTDRLSLSANLNGFVDHGETQAAQLIGILYVTPRLADEVPLLGTYPLAPKNNRAADWDPATNYHKDRKSTRLNSSH